MAGSEEIIDNEEYAYLSSPEDCAQAIVQTVMSWIELLERAGTSRKDAADRVGGVLQELSNSLKSGINET